jgi:hypothetical protein
MRSAYPALLAILRAAEVVTGTWHSCVRRPGPRAVAVDPRAGARVRSAPLVALIGSGATRPERGSVRPEGPTRSARRRARRPAPAFRSGRGLAARARQLLRANMGITVQALGRFALALRGLGQTRLGIENPRVGSSILSLGTSQDLAARRRGFGVLATVRDREAHREDRQRDRQKTPQLLKIASYCSSLTRANIGKFSRLNERASHAPRNASSHRALPSRDVSE